MSAVVPESLPFLGRITLARALERHLGSPSKVDRFLAEALEDAGLEALPEGREAFEAFVRDTVLSNLMPLVRLDELHDFVRRVIGGEEDVHPAPIRRIASPVTPAVRPATRPRVVVVEPDPRRRIEIARGLVRDGFDVEVVPAAADTLKLDPFHAIVMALDAEGERVAGALAQQGTRAGLVTYDDPEAREATRRVIDRWPSDRVSLASRTGPASALCARVRIVLS
jgi:hypothetical protein